jgi:glycosyltransferase 2 family protein
MKSSLRRTVVTVIKFTLAVAILLYLVSQARDGFAKLANQTIDWPFLIAGLACTLLAAGLSFVRWHLLIRALSIDISLPKTMSLGALGLALNFVSPGAIGGDFFKAVFLAHGQPGKRTEAVASVVADRLLGLLTMLALASAGILVTGLFSATSVPVRVLCRTILISTAVCWTGAAMLLFIPALSGNRARAWAESIPLVGATVGRMLGAVHAYRNQRRTLAAAFSISIVMALSFVTSYYSIARGLPVDEPTWAEHLVIVPTAGLVGAIPLTPSGLGTTELAVEELYKTMPGGDGNRQGDGTMVALARRATEIVVALLGLVFYLTHMRKVREVYAEAEEAE